MTEIRFPVLAPEAMTDEQRAVADGGAHLIRAIGGKQEDFLDPGISEMRKPVREQCRSEQRDQAGTISGLGNIVEPGVAHRRRRCPPPPHRSARARPKGPRHPSRSPPSCPER